MDERGSTLDHIVESTELPYINVKTYLGTLVHLGLVYYRMTDGERYYLPTQTGLNVFGDDNSIELLVRISKAGLL